MRLPGVPSDIALLNGPMLLGYHFSYGLLGVLIVQVFLYHLSFPRDRAWIKCLVWTLFFLECLMTILATIGSWVTFASGWGDLDVLARLNWSFCILPGLSGSIASAVHFFFCWRIQKLTLNTLLPVFIIAVSCMQCGAAWYAGVRAFLEPLMYISNTSTYVIMWLGGSAACDVIITATMVALLFKANKNSTFQETRSALTKLIQLTVETGMGTAIGAIAELILFLVFPHNNMHFIVFLFLAKLYSNTLLATLNARAFVSYGSTSSAVHTSRVTPFWEDVDLAVNSRHTNGRLQSAGGVHVTTTCSTDRRVEDVPMVVYSEDIPKIRDDVFAKTKYDHDM